MGSPAMSWGQRHNEPGGMKAIVILQSLLGGKLPGDLEPLVVAQYRHKLDGQIGIDIAELAATEESASQIAIRLAGLLLPEGFYAHILSDHRMLVAFPHCVMILLPNNNSTIERAQRIGQELGIPLSQMRFAEMFHTDHPDMEQPGGGQPER